MGKGERRGERKKTQGAGGRRITNMGEARRKGEENDGKREIGGRGKGGKGKEAGGKWKEDKDHRRSAEIGYNGGEGEGAGGGR